MDGSEVSMRAAKYGFDIAARSNSRCTLHLIHVVPSKVLLSQSSGYFGVVSPGYQKEVEEEAEEWLKIKNKIISRGKFRIPSGGNFIQSLELAAFRSLQLHQRYGLCWNLAINRWGRNDIARLSSDRLPMPNPLIRVPRGRHGTLTVCPGYSVSCSV